MVAEAPPALDEVDDDELDLGPSVDDLIDTPKYPSDDDVPSDMQPKRRRRSKKRERETIETLSQTLAMLNGMFAMMVPCNCALTLPEELRGIAHRDNCVKLYPLDEEETKALAAAIGAEFEAHPDWVDKLANADTWMAHAMLATTVFGIVVSRRMRSNRVSYPDGSPPEVVNAVNAVNSNGVHADAV